MFANFVYCWSLVITILYICITKTYTRIYMYVVYRDSQLHIYTVRTVISYTFYLNKPRLEVWFTISLAAQSSFNWLQGPKMQNLVFSLLHFSQFKTMEWPEWGWIEVSWDLFLWWCVGYIYYAIIYIRMIFRRKTCSLEIKYFLFNLTSLSSNLEPPSLPI